MIIISPINERDTPTIDVISSAMRYSSGNAGIVLLGFSSVARREMS